MSSFRALAVACLVGLVTPALALAQPIGTFRWQIQPYCNILSIAVVQQGGLYLLTGNDDQCGVPHQASVVGLAFQNPDGTIGFGLTIVTAPGGTPVHIDATITLATLGGTWRDSAGNSGALVFTPGAGIPGSTRPVPTGGLPPGSVTTAQLAAGAVDASKLAANAVSGSHVADASLTKADLADAPTAAFMSGDQFVALTPAFVVVRSVSLTAPAAGRVIVSASGYFNFTGAGSDLVQCSLSGSIGFDSTHAIIGSDAATASQMLMPFSGTRGFSVSAGPFAAYLICRGNVGTASILDSSMTAVFIAGS